MRTRLSLPAAACGLLWLAIVPPAGAEVVGPVYGKAASHDVSPPLRQLALGPARQTTLAFQVSPLRAPLRLPRSGATPAAPDLLRQNSAGAVFGSAPTPSPLVVAEGLSDADNELAGALRPVPPDTQGDVGPDHYVQWVNKILAVWDIARGPDGAPTGVVLDETFGIRAGYTVWAGFGGGGCVTPNTSPACACELLNSGDPIVLYDHLADRWLLSQFAWTNDGIQCLALSQTGDPTGSYDRWAFNVSPDALNDYPKIGLMPDSYLLTVRDFPEQIDNFAGIVAFDRQAMLAADPDPRTVKFGLTCTFAECVDGWQPPHLEGPPPPYPVPAILTKVWDDDFDGPVTACDGVRLWQLDVDWSAPGPTPPASLLELPPACGGGFDNDMCGYFVRDCVPQASDMQKLDAVDELQMYRSQYRQFGTHESLLVNSTVDAGGDTAGIRWIELRNWGSGWAIHQEGTYAPADGAERWMGSAAINGGGEIALGFSISGGAPAIDPSIAYNTKASEASGEPQNGTLTGGEVMMHAGTGAQQLSHRWGDYSVMSVDPADDCTFWYTQQYYAVTASRDFRTKIGAFGPPETDLAVDGETLTGDESRVSCGWLTSEATEVQSGVTVFRGRRGVALGNGFKVTGGEFAALNRPDLSLP